MGIAFAAGDRFDALSYSSIAVSFVTRLNIVYTDGVRDTYVIPQNDTSSDRTIVSVAGSILPKNGEVHGIQLVASGATTTLPSRGRTWVAIQHVRGVALENIATGYWTAAGELMVGVISSSRAGPGWLRSFAGTDRAAGVNVQETVPTNAAWRILSVQVTNAQVTTSPNMGWSLDDGTNVFFQTNRLAQTAGQSEVHVVSIMPQQAQDGTSNVQSFPLPDMQLDESFRINTIGIDANSDFSAPQLYVEEWIVP